MASDLVRMFPEHFSDGILFFSEEDTGLESDNWRKSGKCERTQILCNKDNMVLIAQPDDREDKAIFQQVTDQDTQNVPGIKFNIHIYEHPRPKGQPVAFTIEWNDKTHYMCIVKTDNKMRVEFKEGDVPNRVRGHDSNMIFNKIPCSSGVRRFFKFESSLKEGCFLAFERDDETKTTRLIVKEVGDEVDITTELHHSRHLPK